VPQTSATTGEATLAEGTYQGSCTQALALAQANGPDVVLTEVFPLSRPLPYDGSTGMFTPPSS